MPGLRRIPFHKLWDESCKSVSFDRLVELILSFKKLPPKCVENERRVVTATYTDEDGDEITISSDSELLDAFEQFSSSQPPVLRAKAVVMKVPMKKVLRKEAVKEQRKIIKEMKKEAKKEQKALYKNLSPEVERVPAATPKVIRLPSVAPPKTVPKVVNGPTPAPQETNGCNPNFIHGRHTCDGCLTTPIFGTRYHAVNMPDYDLCSKCYPNHNGQHIVFKPMELDRDKHLQDRWQRRYGRCRPMMNTQGRNERPNSSPLLPEVARGTQTRKVIQEMDDALKEAIRRSLIDAARPKKNKKKVVKKEASVKNEVNAEKVFKEVEKDLHAAPTVEKDVHVAPAVEGEGINVPHVVDITAGNEATQKTLDSMDPKVKEALRKKLNAFFARRGGNQSDDQNKGDSTFAPQEDTQRKIDTMDPDAREAICRSLNQFFENHRASKEEVQVENTVVESGDDVKRPKEILDSMDEETNEVIKTSINDFVTRRSGSNSSEASTEDHQTPSVVIDVVVDDDLSVGTDDVDVEGVAGVAGVDTDSDEETADESDSGISDGTASKDEWQMVTEHDEMIAVAAQMLGSALFESDASPNHVSNDDKE